MAFLMASSADLNEKRSCQRIVDDRKYTTGGVIIISTYENKQEEDN